MFSTEKDIIMHTSLKRITFHLGALSSLLKSWTEVLEATLVTRMQSLRMLNDQIELMNVDGVEIDYLDLNVLEPVLSVEDGLVASTGDKDVFDGQSLKVSQFRVLISDRVNSS